MLFDRTPGGSKVFPIGVVGSLGLLQLTRRALPIGTKLGRVGIRGSGLPVTWINIKVKHAQGLLPCLRGNKRTGKLQMVGPSSTIRATIGAKMKA